MESLAYNKSFGSVFVERWMLDEMASAHTDLVLLSPSRLPDMYLFAPFKSRPLGRDLPSIFHTCSCPSIKKPASSTTYKEWIVKHKILKPNKEAPPSDNLSRVKIWILCSRCQQKWDLDTSDVPGKLFAVGGLNYVQLPYFRPLSELGLQSR